MIQLFSAFARISTITVISFALLYAQPAAAGKLGDVQLPDSIDVDGKKLLLNGMGMREATVFKVDVYVAGLYLETKSGKAKEVLASKQNRQIRLVMVRDVSQDDFAEAFANGLENNTPKPHEPYQSRLEKLSKFFSDVKTKDSVVITFTDAGQTRVEVNGKMRGEITGDDFARVMLRMWIGPKPPNEGLKSGMLGAK